MRPNSPTRVLFLCTLALTIVSPPAFGEDGDGDKTKIQQKREEQEKLKEDIEAAKKKLEAIRKNGSEDEIYAAEEEVEKLQSQYRGVKHDVTAADRKARKIDRDAEKVAKYKTEIEALLEQMKGKSGAEIEEIQGKILPKRDEMIRLEKRIARKKKAYEKKAGESLEASRTPPKPPEPPTPPPAPPLSLAEMKKLDGCYTRTRHDLEKKVFVFYPIGGAVVKKTADGREEERKLAELFEKEVAGIAKDLTSDSYGKIGSMRVTSYTSKVKFTKSKRTSQELADLRNKGAGNALFDELFLQSNITREDAKLMSGTGASASFDREDTVPTEPSVGSDWRGGDYGAKEKLKVSDDDIKKAAEMILASQDPTPVRVTGGTKEENLAATIDKLRACCAYNEATLKYQPYQFSEVKVTLPKFDPTLATCTKVAATQISTAVGEKPVQQPEAQPVNRVLPDSFKAIQAK